MPIWICATCGLEHPDTETPPELCVICSDERQYVPESGQAWNLLEDVRRGRTAAISEVEPDLFAIDVAPRVGIGHRPLIVRTPTGNILWDAPGFFDDDLLTGITDLGPLVAIASSHPHLTGLSISISHALGRVPVWYNAADEKWIRRPDPVIQLWSDQHELAPGVTLIQCGGHFDGSAVLHWAAGAGGQGAILVGDTVRPNADLWSVSFMRSYPNLIPLPPKAIRTIAATLEPWPFERIYGGFGETTMKNGNAAVQQSAERYIRHITD